MSSWVVLVVLVLAIDVVKVDGFLPHYSNCITWQGVEESGPGVE